MPHGSVLLRKSVIGTIALLNAHPATEGIRMNDQVKQYDGIRGYGKETEGGPKLTRYR